MAIFNFASLRSANELMEADTNIPKHAYVLGIAAVLAEKQNILFNSEIEYEFGSREIDIEQAYLE